MGFQQLTAAQIIGILHIPRRMMFGNIQCLKTMIIVNDFVIIFNREAHALKNTFNFPLNQRNRMIRSIHCIAGQRIIIRFLAFNQSLLFLPLNLESTLLNLCFYILFQFINQLACLFFLFSGCIFECSHQTGYMSFFSQKLYFQLFCLNGGLYFVYLFFKLLFQFRRFFQHRKKPPKNKNTSSVKGRGCSRYHPNSEFIIPHFVPP